MNIKYVEEVKQGLGEEKVAILSSIFKSSEGLPPGVNKLRFRADHPNWMESLDHIANTGLLVSQDKESKNYRVKAYALPLIDDSHAKALLIQMERAFSLFRDDYFANLDSTTFDVDQAAELLEIDRDDVTEMLCYMMDVHEWTWGHTSDFPFGDNATVSIGESILKYSNFGELISLVYGWHYVNPQSVTSIDQFSTLLLGSEGFFSPNDSHSKPPWFEKLDETKQGLIFEIDKALQGGLTALPTMGLRALIDLVLVEKIGDAGSFKEKLSAFEQEGLVSSQQKKLIYRVLEAGNAASHRGFSPNRDDLQVCVDVIKHMMQGVYDLHPRTEHLKNNTPQRPLGKHK